MKTIREIIRPRKESEPWNKGKIIGQKPPLLPKHVWAIRTKLQMEKLPRDLALFNLAIDSKNIPIMNECRCRSCSYNFVGQ